MCLRQARPRHFQSRLAPHRLLEPFVSLRSPPTHGGCIGKHAFSIASATSICHQPGAYVLAVAHLTARAHMRPRLAQIIKMDKDLLSHSQIGPIARGAGTTSNVIYFKGDKMWVACSGDSRAIMGQQKKGNIVAVDLSNDHKPDLPVERKRIEAAGGVVSAAGPRGLPPSRVWVNGRVGLAMSRSLGDGEAKGYGVIPDPEIKEFTLNPCKGKGDGDKFVVVASDGIWEFISSQQARALATIASPAARVAQLLRAPVALPRRTPRAASHARVTPADAYRPSALSACSRSVRRRRRLCGQACDVVHKHTDATAACAELVQMAEQRWREEEGSYRDDITCICAFLPFLETHPEDDDDNVAVESHVVDIELDVGEQSPDTSPNARRANAKKESSRDDGEEADEGEQFVKRRLSVAQHIDFDEEEDMNA